MSTHGSSGNFTPIPDITAVPMTPQLMRVGATPFTHGGRDYIELFATFSDGQIKESVYRY